MDATARRDLWARILLGHLGRVISDTIIIIII